MEQKPKIEWYRMNARWWLETIMKVGLLIAIFSLGSLVVGDGHPRWVYGLTIMVCLLIGILLIPELPREGVESPSLRDSMLGTGMVALVLIGLAVIGIVAMVFFTVAPEWLRPVVAPLLAWIDRGFNLNSALLIIVIVQLLNLSERLPRR